MTNNKNLTHITAVTEVTATGQKVTSAVITYNKKLLPIGLSERFFEVKDRRITGISVGENKVTLSLDPQDEAASCYHPGIPFRGPWATVSEAKLSLMQKEDIPAADGTMLAKSEGWTQSDQTADTLVDLFCRNEYNGQKYSLFVPENYDPAVKYPLIQFIHDAGVCGSDPKLALAQGFGALVWALPQEQKKHPCFIFAPQFDGPPIVDDDWNVDPRLEDAKRALDHVIETYSIDTDRIYTTGQSMGCMSSMVLNVRYPDLFAASFLVAGQWDERNIPGLEKQKLWMLCSQGDAKAFPGMNQMCVEMEKAGAKVVRRVMDADLTQEEYRKIASELTAEDPDIIFTPYRLETVADGWHSNGGEHHMATWTTAYGIEAIRDWLFAQKKTQ